MKERPILFKGAMVRAILDGTKTQTRRIVKKAPWLSDEIMCVDGLHWTDGTGWDSCIDCPFGEVGDRLWVRETWNKEGENFHDDFTKPQPPYYYAADYEADANKLYRWRPSIFMPRAASRITLEVTGVRVERLQDISEADARAEGVVNVDPHNAVSCYALLWESINGPGSWEENTFVWVVEFRRIVP